MKPRLFWLFLVVGVGCLLALDLEFAPDMLAEDDDDGGGASAIPSDSAAPPASSETGVPSASAEAAAPEREKVPPGLPIEARVPTIVARFDSEGKLPVDEVGIRALATAMIEDHEAKVVLEGHSDQIGSDDMNHDLSLERANVVKARLVELGVSEDRIETVGLGATHPLHSDIPDAASLNRRVEVRWMAR